LVSRTTSRGEGFAFRNNLRGEVFDKSNLWVGSFAPLMDKVGYYAGEDRKGLTNPWSPISERRQRGS
jgi:hypothetical protein